MELILIRHTRCEVAEGTCYGRLDVPLATTAAADIDHTLSQTPSVDLVFSSPLQRCHTLALALAKRDACTVQVLPELQEIHFGEWEGLHWSAIPRSVSDEWAEDPWNRAPPGGESELALSSRVTLVANQLLQVSGARRIAVVSHGGPLRILRCLLAGEPLAQRWSMSMECGQVVSIVPRSRHLTGPPESACRSSDP